MATELLKILDEEIETAQLVQQRYRARLAAEPDSLHARTLLNYSANRVDNLRRIREHLAQGQLINAGFDPNTFGAMLFNLANAVTSGEAMYESGGATINEKDGLLQFTAVLAFRLNNQHREL